MTLAQQITYAERRARVSSNVTTSSTANDITIAYINEGVREFCKMAGGIPKVAYLQLSPKFDVQTNWAIRLTVTSGANALTAQDLVLAATNTASMGGASYASYLAGQISANTLTSISVSWDSTEWEFDIYDTLGSATYWEIGAPDGIGYVDAVPMLLNKVGTQSGTYFAGDMPYDLTLETALPSDCLSVVNVEWDHNQMTMAPFDVFASPQSFGVPIYYAVKHESIRLYPCPERQEMFQINYLSAPTDLSTTTDSCPLKDEYHWAPVYYAAAMLAAENHDWEVHDKNYGMFMSEVAKSRVKEANQNPSMFPRYNPVSPPRVEI